MLAYPGNLKALTKTNQQNKLLLFSLSNLRHHFFLLNCNDYWWSLSLIIDLFSDHQQNVPFFLCGSTSATIYLIVLVPVFRLLHGLGHGTVKCLREPQRHNASDNPQYPKNDQWQCFPDDRKVSLDKKNYRQDQFQFMFRDFF